MSRRRRRRGRRATAARPSLIESVDHGPADRRRDLRRAVVLAIVAFLVYNLNFRNMATGDSLPARFLPFAVWEDGSLHLDSVIDATRGGHPGTYWILTSLDGRFASTYPVVTPLLVTPLYGPAVAYLHHAGRTEERLRKIGELMEKVAASVVSAVTTALVFLLCRRRASRRDATLLAIAFAFGTNTWTTCSQALWQHGAAQLFAVLALLALTSEPGWAGALQAGAATGLLVANRPPDVAMAVGFAAATALWLWKRPRLLALSIGAAAVPCLLTLAYNRWMFGNLSGGYGVIGAASASFFSGTIAEGIAGLLVSPGKGLLLWSPFFAFVPIFYRRVVRDPGDRALAICLTAGFALQLLVYAKTDWRAGFSYGPRFLSETVPMLIWLLVPVLVDLGRVGRALFVATVAFSIWVQAVGAFRYQGGSDGVLFAAPENVWHLDKTPYLLESRSPFVRMPLLGTLFGLEEHLTHPGNLWREVTGSSR